MPVIGSLVQNFSTENMFNFSDNERKIKSCLFIGGGLNPGFPFKLLCSAK